MCLVAYLAADYYQKQRLSRQNYTAIPSSDPENYTAIPSSDPESTAPLDAESTATSVAIPPSDTPQGATDEQQNNQQQALVEAETEQKPPLVGLNQLWFLLPTLCDLTATTLMNVGLMFVSASIYQMLRGSVVLFTGTFSTLFLGINHPLYKWASLFIVFLGVGIVGLSSLFKFTTMENDTSPYEGIGILMVVIAQAFTATQFVVEEKIMKVYSIPAVKAVGLEGWRLIVIDSTIGFFGLTLTVLAVPILHFTLGVSKPLGPGNVFDMYERYKT